MAKQSDIYIPSRKNIWAISHIPVAHLTGVGIIPSNTRFHDCNLHNRKLHCGLLGLSIHFNLHHRKLQRKLLCNLLTYAHAAFLRTHIYPLAQDSTSLHMEIIIEGMPASRQSDSWVSRLFLTQLGLIH